MKKLFVIALMFLSALSAGAQSSLVSQISAACAAAESVQCNFTQTRHLAMMEEAIVSTGKMSYRRPDFLRWEYVSPEPMTLEIDGGTVMVTRGRDGAVSDAGGNKMYRELTKLLMGAVSGRLLGDEKLFSTQASSDGNVITAILIPIRGDMKRLWNKMTMTFDATSYAALRIYIDEVGGGATVIKFTY